MAIVPIGVSDAIPGQVGLVADDHTLVLLSFDEEAQAFPPTDQQGNLAPLGTQTPYTVVSAMPIVAGYCGRARRVSVSESVGFMGGDVVGRDTLATRDATVQALVTIDDVDGNTHALYGRGKGAALGATELRSIYVDVQRAVSPASPVHYRILCGWQIPSTADVVVTSDPFVLPAPDTFVLLTVTRRWESPTRAVIRFYVNDELVSEAVSTSANIAGSTTGTTLVGGRFDNFGGRAGAWAGIIDELQVTRHEMSREEVRAVWRRLTVHQPAGVAMLAAMAPPGSEWGTDASTRMSRLVRIGGTILGYARARAHERVDTWLPDRAYLEDVRRWEQLYALEAKPLEFLDLRRQRVVAFAGRDNGYARDQIKTATAESLDLDPADVEILEFHNRIDDDFTTLETERWWVEPAASWSIVSGKLRLAMPFGSNVSYGTRWHALTSMSSPEGRVVVLGHIRMTATADVLGGLMLWNERTKNALWLGIHRDAVNRVCYRIASNGVLGPRVETTAAISDGWLRLIRDPDVVGRWRLGWSITDPESGYGGVTIDGVPNDLEWAGIGAIGDDTASNGTTNLECDSFTLITPSGTRANTWYVYRDPALPGEYDLVGTNALIRRLKPAHTHAAAVTSRSLLCDHPESGCDSGPLGGI